MSTIARRIAAGSALIIAPALIALGTAGTSHAQGEVRYNGPTHSAPAPNKPFPHQSNFPKPGTPEHHRHQK
ncbi:MAG: hypothetical protein ABWY93_19680, partial [Mycobacterium sp.]